MIFLSWKLGNSDNNVNTTGKQQLFTFPNISTQALDNKNDLKDCFNDDISLVRGYKSAVNRTDLPEKVSLTTDTTSGNDVRKKCSMAEQKYAEFPSFKQPEIEDKYVDKKVIMGAINAKTEDVCDKNCPEQLLAYNEMNSSIKSDLPTEGCKNVTENIISNGEPSDVLPSSLGNTGKYYVL